ncbi:alanine racemase [Candidatus Peregrinibacteria bacterium]|nr:alanine racemase [Candidatus Peregrinibacteria bacterium]
MYQELTWVEISKNALVNNIRQFRKLVGEKVLICPCVKANAYGHGLAQTARIFAEAGADWLAVNALYEAKALQKSGIQIPIYIMGHVPLDSLEEAMDFRLVVYDPKTIERLGEIGRPVKIHLKVETGNNRQGVLIENLLDFAQKIQNHKNIELEGLATHFANIEDTTDHSYAELQLRRFHQAIDLLEKAGIHIPIKHCANSAATILFPKTHFQMVRPGIAAYGMWPSKETYVAFAKERADGFELKPAFTWKTKIAQIKKIPSGECVGYGCTYKTTRETRLAILPIGYYDGYDRGVHGAYVLIHGQRVPVRGRVCMNIIMVDVSDISDVKLEDEVVLIGRDGNEEISAELFGNWAGTINYEITTRVNERIERRIV